MKRSQMMIGVLAALLAGSVGSFGTMALASHVFSDVPDGSFYAESVENIYSAGCANGYPDGTFRTGEPATRGQFAYWTANCGGRSTWNQQSESLSANGTIEIAPVSIAAGGVAGQTGFINLQANVTAYDADGLECPCQISVSINHVGTNDLVGRIARESLDGPTQGGGLYASLSTSGQFVAETSGNTNTEKFTVVVVMNDSDNNPINVSADLSAVYTPFGAYGSDLPG